MNFFDDPGPDRGDAPPGTGNDPATMTDLLSRIRPVDGRDTISMGEVMSRIGSQSFPAVLLVIGLLMVSPLSSVPLLPAFLAIVILLTSVQAMLGRRSLWLPRTLMSRPVKADRVRKALDWLEGPAAWLDRRRSGWLSVLAMRPFSDIGYAVTSVAALSWPPLSLVPLSTTIIAVGMTLIAAGLTLRDGVFVLAGYVWLGLLVSLGIAVWMGLM